MKAWMLMAVVMAAIGLSPVPASARTVRMPVAGWAVIGHPANNAAAWMAVQPWDGSACRWFFLGNYGLDSFTVIYGSSGVDWIAVPVANSSGICGSWTPLKYNGHSIDMHGLAGDDLLGGGYAASDRVYAGAGNDVAYSAWGGLLAAGDDGNDKVYGHDYPSDWLSGGNHNDNICEHSGTTCDIMNGGPGTDTRCGTSSWPDPAMLNTIESVNCSVCGSGY